MHQHNHSRIVTFFFFCEKSCNVKTFVTNCSSTNHQKVSQPALLLPPPSSVFRHSINSDKCTDRLESLNIGVYYNGVVTPESKNTLWMLKVILVQKCERNFSLNNFISPFIYTVILYGLYFNGEQDEKYYRGFTMLSPHFVFFALIY